MWAGRAELVGRAEEPAGLVDALDRAAGGDAAVTLVVRGEAGIGKTRLLDELCRIAERFRTGEGLEWGEHDPMLFEGTERFFHPDYVGNLLSAWIPALEGVEAKLGSGATVADVGCGFG